MKNIRNLFGRFVCLSVLLISVPAWAQSVGRVLVASGEVTVLRANAPQAASAGFALQAGDRVRTGAAGTAQLWFTDSTIVALRSGSEFLVEQYEYRGLTTDAVVFNLLRGGFRTVAGIVGAKDGQYKVKTPIATVGRRGTQFGLVYCAQDCPLPAGGLAPDGLYGGVYDGRISVANSTPERVFGRDEYFYVASINSIPTPLLGPPSFFADRLQGLAKNAQKPASEPPASSGSAGGDSAAPAEPQVSVATGYNPNENRGADGKLLLSPSRSYAYLAGYSVNLAAGGTSGFGVVDSGTTGSNLDVRGSGSARSLNGFTSGTLASGSLGSGTLTMQGYDANAEVSWGRWSAGSTNTNVATYVPGSQTPQTGVHYLLGTATEPAVIAAKTGSFTFSDLGGTTPTASNGQTATAFTFGPILIDFTNRTGSVTSVSVTFASAQWTASAIPVQFLATVPGIIGIRSAEAAGVNSASCSGAACGAAPGPNNARIGFNGIWMGGTANYLGVNFFGNANSTANFQAARLFGNPQPYTPPPAPPVALVFAGSLIETNGSVASYGGAVSTSAANLTTTGTGPAQTLTAFNLPAFTFSGAVGGANIDMAGYDALSGVYYGRWIDGRLTSGSQQQPNVAPGTQTSGMGVHYLYGSPTPDTVIAAKTGTFQYVDYVGTYPTASNGESASYLSVGPIDINFTARTGTIQSVFVEFPNSQWNFSNLGFSLNATPGQGASFSGNLPNAGSCVGSACGPIQGSNSARADFEGRFIGASGNFLGLTFHGNSGGNTPSGNPNLSFGMVRLFKCPSCP